MFAKIQKYSLINPFNLAYMIVISKLTTWLVLDNGLIPEDA